MSLLDLVREFVVLSGESEWGGDSLPRVKELMVELRRRGFTSLEVSELSGNRWKDSVVRGYTRNWGGVVVDMSEKARIISALRSLVSSNCTIESVEWFTKVDESIRLKQSTPEEVAELNKNLGDLGIVPGEVRVMLAVSRSVREEPGGIKGVRDRIVLDKELRDQGVTHEVMLSLKEKCERYGRVSGLLEGMNRYMTIQDMKSEYASIDANLAAKKEELVEVSARLEREEGVVKALAYIYSMGWTPLSLMAFPLWLRANDTPEVIGEALKDTRSIQDLQARIKDLSKRHSALDIENVNLTRENIRALDRLEELTQKRGMDTGQDFNKWREELNRKLHLKPSGDDALTFISLLTDYVEIDPKSYEVNKVLLKAISNFLLALEACKEVSGYFNLIAFLRLAKTELESNVRNWEIAEKLTKVRSK